MPSHRFIIFLCSYSFEKSRRERMKFTNDAPASSIKKLLSLSSRKTSGTSQVFIFFIFFCMQKAAEKALRWWKGMKLMLQTYSIILLCKVFFMPFFSSSISFTFLQTRLKMNKKKSSIYYIQHNKKKWKLHSIINDIQ